MKIVIIGGTGHVGTYLVPQLVEAGHEVTCITRARRQPYHPHPSWVKVKTLLLDREELDASGAFGDSIRALSPEVVIDMICFTPESARQLVSVLNGAVRHFIHCGTMWVHGYSVEVPTSEDQPRRPFGEYGIKKAAIEKYLLEESEASGFPVTILHPGHIAGPGWPPVNPQGNLNLGVFEKLRKGEELLLPNFGMETVHHVHAADVAQAFVKALEHRNNAVGQSFHVVSAKALTLRGFAEAVAEWFGQTAKLKFLPWEEWQKTVSETDARITWDHIAHSPNGSIGKARSLIGYEPVYSSLDAVREAIASLGVFSR